MDYNTALTISFPIYSQYWNFHALSLNSITISVALQCWKQELLMHLTSVMPLHKSVYLGLSNVSLEYLDVQRIVYISRTLWNLVVLSCHICSSLPTRKFAFSWNNMKYFDKLTWFILFLLLCLSTCIFMFIHLPVFIRMCKFICLYIYQYVWISLC